MLLKETNWLGDGDAPPTSGARATIKLRSLQAPAAARIEIAADGTGAATLDDAQYGVSAGQACVFYDGDRVLGGGWITGAERSPALIQSAAA